MDALDVGRNKPVRVTARTGVSGKHLPNSPETPPRATRLDGLIPAYILAWEFGAGSSSFPPREAATVWMQEVEQRREQLPRASLSEFPSRRLGTRVMLGVA